MVGTWGSVRGTGSWGEGGIEVAKEGISRGGGARGSKGGDK